MAARVWWDGGLVDAADAVLPVGARAVQYGYGFFETLRAYDGVPFRLAAHLARFAASGDALRLPIPPIGSIEQAVHATLAANNLRDAAVRVTALATAVVGGPPAANGVAVGDADPDRAALLVTAHTPPDWSRAHAAGVSAVLSRFRRDPASPLGGVKPTSALTAVLAGREAREAGADEAILLTTDGVLSETAHANLFLVREGVLLTPSLDCGCLPGVTRAVVLERAPLLGLSVSEGRFKRAVLETADECFMTGSIREIVPIVTIDGRDVGAGTPGPVTQDVQAAYAEAVRAEVAAVRP